MRIAQHSLDSRLRGNDVAAGARQYQRDRLAVHQCGEKALMRRSERFERNA